MAVLFEPRNRTEDIALAMSRLIAREGIDALTTRRVALEVGLSYGTLGSHFGSKRQMVGRCLVAQCRMWTAAMTSTVGWQGLPGFLPPEPSMIWLLRAWLGWREIARSLPEASPYVAAADAEEEQLLGQAIGRVAGEGLEQGSSGAGYGPGASGLPVLTEASVQLEAIVQLLHASLAGIRDRLCVVSPHGEGSAADLTRAQELWASACGVSVASIASAAAARKDCTIASGSSAE
jgi:AcrR family transcriptional regulator